MATWRGMLGWFGMGGPLTERGGDQFSPPSTSLHDGIPSLGADAALQLSAIWACIERRATTIASLPFVAFMQKGGDKTPARTSRLYGLLHDSPNSRMTPFEFWRAMLMNYDLRGNAYARIDRNAKGEAVAMWPMPADQVRCVVQPDNSVLYEYRFGGNVAIFAESNVLHMKNLGNGTVGLAKLEFMRATTYELSSAQSGAAKLFANGGKPTGVLMIDKVLTEDQRTKIRRSYADLAETSSSRIAVLEANMKYQQLSISAEDQQLLESRRFGIEEICRWFDVPPVLIHHSNVTTWGSGISEIVVGFHKFTIRPMLVSIEQTVRKRVLTPEQRVTMDVEFNLDALLRGNITERYAVYSQGTQNGILTRNEARQLENLPPIKGADELTAQSNLLPLAKLGQVAPPSTPQSAPLGEDSNASAKKPIAQ